MASCARRQTAKTAAKALLLLAAAAPFAGFAQAAFEPTANSEQQRQVVDEIRDERSQNGTSSVNLIEPLTTLALLYEEDGDRALATAAIEQARQVARVNYGLYSLEEASLIRQEIDNESARGDAARAWDLEQKLLTLVGRHPDDLRSVPILREIADERIDILSRYRTGEFPPQIVLGCYYHYPATRMALSGSCQSGSREDVIRSLAAQARAYYREAIGVMVRNHRYSSDELRDLEARLIRASYSPPEHQMAARIGPSPSDYATGKRSYRRLMSYNAATAAPWLDRVSTFVEMTDWDLLFSQHAGTEALDAEVADYEQAYDSLESKGVAQTSIDGIFSPKIPVVLPTFLPNPLASDESAQSNGYIDVAFDITKYGQGRNVDIVGATDEATSAAKRQLVHLIKSSLFRPRVIDGRCADASRVVVRYYLAQ